MIQKFKVALSRRAEADIHRLEAWLLDKDPGAARDVREFLRAAVRSLSEFPARGRPSPSGSRDLILPFGRAAYRIRYLIVGDRVLVTVIQHSRESPW